MLSAINSANPFEQLAGYARFLLTEMYFRAVMTVIVHEDSVPFADKVAMVENYKQICPLYKHDATCLQNALDRINPAYTGMGEFRSCGERFYRTEGEWKDIGQGALSREDSYLHVATQKTHTLSYAYHAGMGVGTIILDGAIVWGTALGQKVNTYHELPALGVNKLLDKLGVLPF